MLVGAVGVDLVGDDPEVQRMRACYEPIKVCERAEDWSDTAVIGNVVTEVSHRRGEEGRKPDCVDAQARNVIALAGDAGKVSDPVIVRVGKAARIDLVNCRALPPGI